MRTGLSCSTRDRDDRAEVLVAPLAADVARVDAVLASARAQSGILREQQVAVVVEVADDRARRRRVSARRATISGTAAAASSLLTVTRTSCEPARASAAT